MLCFCCLVQCCCNCCGCIAECVCKPIITFAKRTAKEHMKKKEKAGVYYLSMHRGPVSVLKCRVNGHRVKALFDTGANVTCIRRSLLKPFKLNMKLLNNKTAKAANGTKLSLMGITTFGFQISANDDETFITAAVVADGDIPYGMVLGTPFMKDYNIFFSFDDDTEEFKLILTKKDPKAETNEVTDDEEDE